jgi:hypothetical protein
LFRHKDRKDDVNMVICNREDESATDTYENESVISVPSSGISIDNFFEPKPSEPSKKMLQEIEELKKACQSAIDEKLNYQKLWEEQKFENSRVRLLSTEVTRTNEESQVIIVDLRDNVGRYAIEVEQLLKVNLHLQEHGHIF